MEFDQGLKAVADGRALLFVGAGFSRGATNLLAKDFALGADLATALADEADLPKGIALDDTAELYVNKLSVEDLVEKVKLFFTAKAVHESHQQIAAAPWRRIYTTNYDDVFELACSNIGKRLDSVIPTDDIAQLSKKHLIAVHLNGLVRRTTRDSIWSDLKLTQGSYDRSSALDTEWGRLFRSDLEAARAVFFVGYSLADIDVRRLLTEEEMIDKSFFVLGPSPSIADAHRVVKYGLPIAKGTAEFATQLADFSTTYLPEENAAPLSFCLNSYEAPVNPVELEDREVFDLLLLGRLSKSLVPASLQRQVNYTGRRQAVDIALSRIEHGNRVVALTASLGNGKTVAMEELKYLAYAKGYQVFTLARRGESFAEELQNALLATGKKCFFIDNYVEWLDTFVTFGIHRSEEFTLVISARSSSHDVLIDRVSEHLGITDIVEVPLDEMGQNDLEWIVDYFDEFGLWGDQATFSRLRKASYLKNDCRAEWQGILLKLLESPHIVERLQDLFGAFKTQGIYRETVIRLLILSVLAYSPSTPILIDLCGDPLLESGFRKDAVARELIDFRRSPIGMHSSVTAEVLLRQVADPNVSVRALIGLIGRAELIAGNSSYNEELFKSLVRFSNLRLVFSEKERGRAGMRVYEAVKNLTKCKRSPLFWLQYAIAALVARSFDRAKAYFDNAYSFANQLYGYDSYQIDNHYARFLLERVMFRQDAGAAMETFREARGLILPQLVDERRHYPYRVASHWGPFFVLFGENLEEADRAEVRRAAEYVVKRIEALPPDRARHRSVVESWDVMQEILRETEPKVTSTV